MELIRYYRRHPFLNCQHLFELFLTHDSLPLHIGAEVFFPETEARRNHLLSMVDKVMEESKAASLALTFESLCRFFSNKDASGLLGLPDIVPEVRHFVVVVVVVVVVIFFLCLCNRVRIFMSRY